MSVLEQKKQLRRSCLARRQALLAAEREEADGALCHAVLTHPAFARADLILAFFPVQGEPNLLPVVEEAKKRGIPVAFPRCEGKEMRFFIVEDPHAMPTDRFHIPAPSPNAPEAVCSASTLCLMPGLAATQSGKRLGYGGGFYDRFLDTFPGFCLFPIYTCLLLPDLPTEATDHRADAIVTEKGELSLYVQANPGAPQIP